MFEAYVEDEHLRITPINPKEGYEGDRLKLDLVSLIEGEFSFGYLNGYGRRLYKNIECHVGFWKDSVPFGKFILY